MTVLPVNASLKSRRFRRPCDRDGRSSPLDGAVELARQDPSYGELKRKRHAVQAATDPHDVRRVLIREGERRLIRGATIDEQADRLEATKFPRGKLSRIDHASGVMTFDFSMTARFTA